MKACRAIVDSPAAVLLRTGAEARCGAWLLLQDHQKKTLSPTWNEDKWLLVQEAKTQHIRAQVFDHDAINLKVRAQSQP